MQTLKTDASVDKVYFLDVELLPCLMAALRSNRRNCRQPWGHVTRQRDWEQKQ